MDFLVEWDGPKDERLEELLVKTAIHQSPSRLALNSHLISVRNKAKLSETLGLLIGFPGLPSSLQTSPVFLSFLSVAIVGLLSPRDFILIPDSAGDILKIFQMRGFHRTISSRALGVLLGDSKIAEEGISFLVRHQLVERAEEGTYRLLEVPLSNVKVHWL